MLSINHCIQYIYISIHIPNQNNKTFQVHQQFNLLLTIVLILKFKSSKCDIICFIQFYNNDILSGL